MKTMLAKKTAKQADLLPAGNEEKNNKKDKPNVRLEIVEQYWFTLHCLVVSHCIKNEIHLDPINPLKFSNMTLAILYKIIQY